MSLPTRLTFHPFLPYAIVNEHPDFSGAKLRLDHNNNTHSALLLLPT